MKALVFYLILLLIFTFFSYKANSTDKNHTCDKHPIYCHILDNKPNINRVNAFKLSNVIHSITTKYNLDAKLFTAILAQESMYRVSAKNCTKGIVEMTGFNIINKCTRYSEIGSILFIKCIEGKRTYKKVSVCTDFGIGQIWYNTADNYKFDIHKLTSDMHYSVEAAAIVLKDFKDSYGHKEKTWWTRYNSRHPNARDKYRELVEGFFDAK